MSLFPGSQIVSETVTLQQKYKRTFCYDVSLSFLQLILLGGHACVRLLVTPQQGHSQDSMGDTLVVPYAVSGQPWARWSPFWAALTKSCIREHRSSSDSSGSRNLHSKSRQNRGVKIHRTFWLKIEGWCEELPSNPSKLSSVFWQTKTPLKISCQNRNRLIHQKQYYRNRGGRQKICCLPL